MPCEHFGPFDIIPLAEAFLRERGIAEEQWPGTRVVFGENTPGTMWESVVTGLERRGDKWIVVQLDRRKEPLADDQLGLHITPALERQSR